MEWEEYLQNRTPISVMQFHDMEEMLETYYRTIFLCRRIEYGIGPENELINYICKKKLSYIYVMYILEKEQIDNKEKVKKKIEGIWPDYGSR